jgi:hypothetical protein
MTDRRAISDAIGFVLVFGIVISTVAVVYVGGFNSLDNARQFERMNNAERAFEVFADNVEDISQRGAPTRATEVKLAEASIQEGPRRTIAVNASRVSDRNKDISRNVSYWPVVYESQTDTSNQLFYALGATFRASSGGTTMSTEPTWIVEDSRVIIPVIQTEFVGSGGVTGSDTVLVRTAHQGTELLVDNATHSTDVNVTMNTPRARAWRTYLEDENDGVDCPAAENDDDTVYCEIEDVETVYVTRVIIEYEFE